MLFEYSPVFIIACLALGALYAYLLYQSNHPWPKRTNQVLFLFRAITVSFLAFLLIGPILKLSLNEYEKPTMVFLLDNSASVKEGMDTVQWAKVDGQLKAAMDGLAAQGYRVEMTTLDEREGPEVVFDHPTSDLNGAARNVVGKYEGKNLAGVVVVTDGIYNSGSSPLFSPSRVPIYTVGVGDTTQRMDIVLRNVAYNKIAYQGNRFPLRAEVLVQGAGPQNIEVSVYQKGKLVARENKASGHQSLLDFDFQLEATEKGLQRIDISVAPLPQERNKKNNRASAFIEVVEGKKKILMVAPAPHPDIKAIRTVVEENANYEFALFIPGVNDVAPQALEPENIDLAIFHQALDYSGKTMPLFKKLLGAGTSLFVMLGDRSNLRQLAANGIPVTFENPGQWDEVTPVINPDFKDFGFSDKLNNIFSRYPPARAPFGKFAYPPNASVLLYQRIGRVPTDRPLLFTTITNGQKMAVLVGDGVWRWRLDEFAETQKTEGFDEVFLKLVQYLGTREDKRKFRSFSLQNEFTTSVPVVFESQVYNELFEQVYGQKIEIELTDGNGKKFQYSYVTSPGNSRYRIGGLAEGVYSYTSSTELEGTRHTARGEFLVLGQNIESQDLTADFNLLRKWAANTGGQFYKADGLGRFVEDLSQVKAQALIHSEESFNPLINLKLVFFFLLALISVEWFARKYMGGY